jgi:hypothetical protein
VTTWQVFSRGETLALTVDADGLTVAQTVLPWDSIQSIRYPTGFNVLLELTPEFAEDLELPEGHWALGFRSGADQRGFREEVDGLHRAAGNQTLTSKRSTSPAPLARLASLTLVGGYEFRGLAPGAMHSLTFSDMAVEISAASGPRVTVPYDGLLVLGTEGPGAVTTGGGFLGGGFGLKGAAEGILAASVLNALTRRTTVEAYLEVQDSDSYWIFMSESQTPAQLERMLKPVRARMRVPHGRPAARSDEPSSVDLVDQLERLAALRTAGALSDEQFEVAKSKLLG